MQGEIIRVSAADGVSLTGLLRLPISETSSLPIDACIMLHARGGNFCTPSPLDDFAGVLLQHRCTIFRVNTRGSSGEMDLVRSNTGRMRIGAACEVVDHCRYDISAWIEEAKSRGYSRIALWGHSLGGVKSIYYQAHTQDPRVCCIVAISPPFLSHKHYMSQPEGQAISQAYHHAKSLVEADCGDDIFEVPGPLPRTLSSAAQYVDKYGPDDNYNILKILPEISCPLMITLGTEEAKTMLVFRGFYDQVRALESELPLLQTVLIQDADHRYTGVREKVLDAVMPWLNMQVSI